MLRRNRWFLLAIGWMMTMAACGDLPTDPSARAEGREARLGSDCGMYGDAYLLCPVRPTVPGPSCDPWLDGDWCRDDECISSAAPAALDGAAIASCPIGGDPPGGPADEDDGGGGGGPPPLPEVPTDTCNTGDPVLDDVGVFGGFAKLWRMSTTEGVERGGWIVRDASGRHTLVYFQAATYAPCGINVLETPPPGTIAILHTHPYSVGVNDPCGSWYFGTPSEEDQQALRDHGLATGYLIDVDGIGRFLPTGAQQADRSGRCGY
jgi:hypothetical protein